MCEDKLDDQDGCRRRVRTNLTVFFVAADVQQQT